MMLAASLVVCLSCIEPARASGGPAWPGRHSFQEPLRKGPGPGSEHAAGPTVAELYLSTLRDVLTGSALQTPSLVAGAGALLKQLPFQDRVRHRGEHWCAYCYTLVGTARLTTVWRLLERTIAEGVPGDFVEAGVWKGGNSIFARAVQRVLGEGARRRTYVCDSFAGVPKASTSLDDDDHSEFQYLSVPLEKVRDHFERFQMLDGNVVFVKGLFSESLPRLRRELGAEGRRIAVLYGDGDLFESFYDILCNLYEFVAVGGYFFCDDCRILHSAMRAVVRFRRENGISEDLVSLESSYGGVYWRKEQDVRVNYSRYRVWNSSRRF